MNNILTDIINLIRRRKIVKTAKKKDVLVLGTTRPNGWLQTSSPQPEEDVNLITVGDLVQNSILPLVQQSQARLNFERTVCIPISTSSGWPDDPNGINWYANNMSLEKWTPTAINPKLHKDDFKGEDLRVEVRISAMANNSNPVNWTLRLTNPLNTLEYVDLLTESSPNSSQLITIGGGYGNFGPGWTRTDGIFAGAGNLKTIFFDQFNVAEGELELYIQNTNGQDSGIIITGCGVSFTTN
ncbi:MAG: hypothetical protein CM15mV42_1380 [uncultured marine virus]|nr:MAG: hypothetical protein CM15mV42_1380 [uncultured marine virus]